MHLHRARKELLGDHHPNHGNNSWAVVGIFDNLQKRDYRLLRRPLTLG
jgi:hypothetical protein